MTTTVCSSSRLIIAGCASVLLAATARALPTPAQKCQAAKAVAAGRYTACWQTAQGKLVQGGDQTKYDAAIAKCVARLHAAFAKAEVTAVRAYASCPTTGDAAQVLVRLTGDAEAVAAKTTGTAPTALRRLPATGQTTPSVAGDDGTIKAGAALQYVDNGNGTISDVTTGLMWEKKIKLDDSSDAANLNDADNCYPWQGQCAAGGAPCGVDTDCGGDGPCDASDCQGGTQTIFKWVAALNAASFAGYTDWRVPNKKELESIVDAENIGPAVAAAFNGANCGATCTALGDPACSCTRSDDYWSSTTVATYPSLAWGVHFYDGGVTDNAGAEDSDIYVRAVRGGL